MGRTSRGPLAYTGVRSSNPPQQIVNRRRAPTAQDYLNFNIGDLWLYMDMDTPEDSELYQLVSNAENVAVWNRLSDTNQVWPDHAVVLGSGTDAINSVSPTTAGFVLTSNGPSADPTWQAAAGGGIENLDGDTGTATGTTVDIAGGTGITTVASGSTVTVNLDSPVLVLNGGTGSTSLTAYAPICGGTTAVSPVQAATTGIGNVGYVLTSTGSGSLPTWQPATGGGSGGLINIQVFDTPGAATYTPTAGMETCIVQCVGGGGGGRGVNTSPFPIVPGQGGGGGGYSQSFYDAATIGASQDLFVGDGGAGGASSPSGGSDGDDGEDTTFGTIVIMTAGGGKGGAFSLTPSGGTATGGDINISGQNGGNSFYAVSDDTPLTYVQVSGSGGSSLLGFGGVSTSSQGFVLPDGQIYGGGGAGAATSLQLSGNGAQGVVIVYEYAGGGGGGSGIQNIDGDTGTATGSTVNIVGGTGVTTSATGDTLTISLAGGGSGGLLSVQVFDAPGSHTYTPTAGMTSCIVQCVGGGGGGQGQSTINGAGSGGGGGGFCQKFFDAATIGASQSLVVGDGGAGGAANASGSDGEDTTFGTVVILTAEGGAGAAATNFGGAGGGATGGDINISGGRGGSGFTNASSSSNQQSGYGGSSLLGFGSASVSSLGGAFDGQPYGGGGSGNGFSGAAGSGASGAVIVYEYAGGGSGGSGIQDIDGDTGTATGSTVNIVGGTGITTSASGDTVTISLTGGGGGGAEVFIATLTANNDTELVFDATMIDGTYSMYKFRFNDLFLDNTGASALNFIVSTNDGATYIGASAYKAGTYSGLYSAGLTNVSSTLVNGIAATAAYNRVNGYLEFYNTQSSDYASWIGETIGDDGVARFGLYQGTVTIPSAINNIKFESTGGVLTSGTITLYGISTTGGGGGSGGVDTLTADTGGPISPSGGDINIFGGAGISTAGSGSSITVNLDVPVVVASGGTGLNVLSTYALLAGGTTGTGNVQQVSGLGTSGQVLTSAGAGALPTWQTPSSGGIATLNGDTGSATGSTVTIAGGTGITSSATGSTVTLNLDSPVSVINGGTGDTSLTAYAPICGGTTAVSPVQAATTGLSNVGYVLTSTGTGSLPTWQASGSGGTIVTTYTSGSGTHNINAGTKFLSVALVAGGTGGGSGRRGASGASCGGGGGGNCMVYMQSMIPAGLFGSTVAYQVGVGGAGGAAVTTDNTNGNDGSFGTDTFFGNIVAVASLPVLDGFRPGIGGGPIGGGTDGGGGSGIASGSVFNVASGGSAGGAGGRGDLADGISAAGNIGFSLSTGGGGGGGAVTGTPTDGGDGGSFTTRFNSVVLVPGSAGGVSGGNGADGSDMDPSFEGFFFGTGGGGGGGNDTGAGGNGGDGGYPGGAGGGGGGSLNGFNSGAGGDGADGWIQVIEYL